MIDGCDELLVHIPRSSRVVRITWLR